MTGDNTAAVYGGAAKKWAITLPERQKHCLNNKTLGAGKNKKQR